MVKNVFTRDVTVDCWQIFLALKINDLDLILSQRIFKFLLYSFSIIFNKIGDKNPNVKVINYW